MLGVSPRTAMNLLKRWGVGPYADFGHGRGLGTRWLTSEILAAVKKTRPHRETHAPRPPKRKRKHALDSDTIIDDLFS